MKIEIHCLDNPNIEIPVVCLDWYDGKNGYIHSLCPSLAICYENGRLQLMCNENDPSLLKSNILIKFFSKKYFSRSSCY